MRALVRSVVLIAGVSSSGLAWAQVPLLPELSRPVPSAREALRGQIPEAKRAPAPSQDFTAADADHVAAHLKQRWERLAETLKNGPVTCASPEAGAYALALHAAGDFAACQAYARGCAADPAVTDPRPILQGALCASARYDFDTADRLFEAASATRFAAAADYMEVIYQYASYALYGIHEDAVDGILARAPGLTPDRIALWKGVIQRVGSIQISGGLSKDEVDRFLDGRTAEADGLFKEFLQSLRLNIDLVDYNYADSLRDLKTLAPGLSNPLSWYAEAYNILYYGLDQRFSLARKIYDAYDPYANSWSQLPVENNTYDYSEIYGHVCHDQLIQGQAAKAFSAFKDDLRAGRKTPAEALEFLEAFNRSHPDKADVLTALGAVYSMLDRRSEAVTSYWRAHRLCRYYNRANWGLTLEKRFQKYLHMPDYQKNLDRLTRELDGRQIPSQAAAYFLDWNSLSPESHRRIAYGARIWLPYIGVLQRTGHKAYIKYAFELLSEAPGMSHIRDHRILNTSHDNRLWDDVRGLGGDTVIADLSEVSQTVQGAYNLLGHEMAHQYQFLMEKHLPAGLRCLTALYEQAKRTGNFPDPYAAGNKEEHFAQSVTYYLVPPDSPQRFGLNRNWLETHDTDELAFIQSIEASDGHLERVRCPLHLTN